jgi:23S rRNA maturation mini-RNase III
MIPSDSSARNTQPAAASKRQRGPASSSETSTEKTPTFRQACSEYIRKHAEAAELAKRLELLREIAMEGLRRGQKSPADLPFLLEIQESERTIKDYKTPLLEALVNLLGSEEQAQSHIEEIESEFETNPVESLVVKPNRLYIIKKL